MNSQKRLANEEKDLLNCGLKVNKVSDILWEVTLQGQHGSPFDGGTFVIAVEIKEFPFKAPVFSFKTPIYHPNVSEKGEICKDMLETNEWQPTKKLSGVFDKIKSMMVSPNPDTPLNEKAAADYRNKIWEKKAAEDTKKFAK